MTSSLASFSYTPSFCFVNLPLCVTVCFLYNTWYITNQPLVIRFPSAPQILVESLFFFFLCRRDARGYSVRDELFSCMMSVRKVHGSASLSVNSLDFRCPGLLFASFRLSFLSFIISYSASVSTYSSLFCSSSVF